MKPRVLNKRRDGVPLGAVYVGRPSKWGNPYRIGVDGTREEVVQLYRERFPKPSIRLAQKELRGKDLVCWCAPLPCHADFLLEIANANTEAQS